jgi:hypothetical protein
MKLKANFRHNIANAWGDNLFASLTGVLFANLTDFSIDSPSGIEIVTSNTWTNNSNSSLILGTSDQFGIPQSVWESHFYVTTVSSPQVIFRNINPGVVAGGLVDGATYQVTVASLHSSAATTTWNCNGVTGTYSVPGGSGLAAPPAPPALQAIANVDGSGRVQLVLSLSSTYTNSYISFVQIDDAPIISIVNGDDTVKIGRSFTFAASGLTPTSGTIDGVALTSVTGTTAVMPNYVDGAAIPDYGYRTLSLTDGEKTATRGVYVYPPDEYDRIRIRDISKTGDGYLKRDIPSLAHDDAATFLIPSALVPSVAVNTIDFDGAIRTDYIGTQMIMVRSKATGIVTVYSLVTDGISPPVVVKIRTISASHIKGSFLKGNYLKGSVL